MHTKQTGKPKNVAYIRFQVPDVAKIAADAMDNYLMFGKLMRCESCPHVKHVSHLFAVPFLLSSNVMGSSGNTVPKEIARHRKLFLPKPEVTSVERHKAMMNKEKTKKGLKKSRRKKEAMMKKCTEILSLYGLSFQPVVIGKPSPEITAQTESSIGKKRKTGTKVVKARVLMRNKPQDSATDPSTIKKNKKTSGLKVETITPSSKRVSSSKQKSRFL